MEIHCKMKKLRLIILLLSLLSTSAHAQRLRVDARVIDAKTAETLPFASVYISGQNSTITNAVGEFVIDADSTDMLRISYVGYKTVYVCAADVGEEVLLSSEGEMLGEVVVLGTDLIINKVLEKIKKESKQFGKKKSNFFYRQVSYTDRNCSSFLESFFSANNAHQIKNMSLVTGRYVAVASLRTVNPANFFTFAEVPLYSSEKNIRPDQQIVPLHKGYKKVYETDVETISNGERSMYVLYFVPRDSNRWAVLARLYIDAETFQVMKYEGVSNGEYVQHMAKKNGKWSPYRILLSSIISTTTGSRR